jgi:hypothetical protein
MYADEPAAELLTLMHACDFGSIRAGRRCRRRQP